MNNPVSSIALLEKTLAAEVTAGPYRLLPLAQIRPNPGQPRRIFAENLEAALQDPEFQELVASVQAAGRILQPLLVQPPDLQGHHVIVAGERRYHAALAAGLTEVPALLVEETDPFTLKLYALIENLHRQDLSLWDRAQYLADLLEESGLSKKELAARIGITPSQLSKYLAVLAAPPEIIEAVQDQIVTDTEAVRFLKEAEPEVRRTILGKAQESGQPVSRRHAERAAGPHRKPALASATPSLPSRGNDAGAEGVASSEDLPTVALPRLTRPQFHALLRHLGADPIPDDEAAFPRVFLELVNRLN